MHLKEIVQFVEGTSDAAFAVDGLGIISAWNRAAAEIFGISPAEVVGKSCCEVVRGMDESGTICADDCVVKQSANNRQPMHNFDLQIETPEGRKWFNISVVMVDASHAVQPYTIHILRQVDVSKRMEMLLRDFVVGETNIPEEQVDTFISSTRSVIQDNLLTRREIEILRLVAKGKTSSAIAELLCISPTTVDNHLQHILKKLKAHSRLEAVRRAEHAGLF